MQYITPTNSGSTTNPLLNVQLTMMLEMGQALASPTLNNALSDDLQNFVVRIFCKFNVKQVKDYRITSVRSKIMRTVRQPNEEYKDGAAIDDELDGDESSKYAKFAIISYFLRQFFHWE